MNILHVIPEFSVEMGGPAIALKSLSAAFFKHLNATALAALADDKAIVHCW